MAEEFEPKIVAFLCKWCSSAGSDLAGVTRMEYPSNAVPITVMCSGSVSPLYIFSAFKKGADGVLVSGELKHDRPNSNPPNSNKPTLQDRMWNVHP